MGFDLPLFPDQASTMATRVDHLYFYLLAVSAFFTILITAMLIFFAIRYRRARHPNAVPIEGSTKLELAWTGIPLIIAMSMFVWAANIFFAMNRPPRGALEIYAVGKQWMWKFEHVGGQREINQLHVPVGRDVKLTMISQDVIHSMFFPAFRVKQDVLPNRYTTVWFHPTKIGTYHLFCAEYCGTKHSGMIGQVVVMEPAQYQAWLAGGAQGGSLVASGERLFRDLACDTCHRPDTGARGPDLAGLFGKPVRFAGGGSAVADETYIRESITNPAAKVVEGFQPIMPTFQGQVSEEGLLQLVAYIKSLQTQTPAAAPGAPPAAAAPPRGNP
ncbi:MAG TPA: cytochrome c oxidase subunit II [Terriglobales bacterium]|nr:cytochrome c oxidase subunit II [Terriglobales bacterium]